jgi:Glycosyltransferase family 87
MAATMTRDEPARDGRSVLDRLLDPIVLVGALVAVFAIYANVKSHSYGFDFRGGAWAAGRDVLAGRSPYEAPDAARLLAVQNAYIPPPLLAVLSVPLSVMPFVPAAVLLNVVCTAALMLALRAVGVSDWRVYALALTSFPFVSSIILGQPDALLMLGVALAWRYRSSWRGAAAVGTVIALKLLAWPLLLWLVVTRRFRQAGVASVVAVALTVGSWS